MNAWNRLIERLEVAFILLAMTFTLVAAFYALCWVAWQVAKGVTG